MLTEPHVKDKYILHLICDENHKSVKITGAAAINHPFFGICSHFFTLMRIRQTHFAIMSTTAHGLYRRAYAEQKSGKGVS